jgi:hypothetical protein
MSSEIVESNVTEMSDTKLEIKPPRITDNCGNLYKYLVYAAIVITLIYLCFYANSCFKNNKNIEFPESYINGSPRDDPQVIDSFDVEFEVKKLIQMQEKFLEKLHASRGGN